MFHTKGLLLAQIQHFDRAPLKEGWSGDLAAIQKAYQILSQRFDALRQARNEMAQPCYAGLSRFFYRNVHRALRIWGDVLTSGETRARDATLACVKQIMQHLQQVKAKQGMAALIQTYGQHAETLRQLLDLIMTHHPDETMSRQVMAVELRLAKLLTFTTVWQRVQGMMTGHYPTASQHSDEMTALYTRMQKDITGFEQLRVLCRPYIKQMTTTLKQHLKTQPGQMMGMTQAALHLMQHQMIVLSQYTHLLGDKATETVLNTSLLKWAYRYCRLLMALGDGTVQYTPSVHDPVLTCFETVLSQIDHTCRLGTRSLSDCMGDLATLRQQHNGHALLSDATVYAKTFHITLCTRRLKREMPLFEQALSTYTTPSAGRELTKDALSTLSGVRHKSQSVLKQLKASAHSLDEKAQALTTYHQAVTSGLSAHRDTLSKTAFMTGQHVLLTKTASPRCEVT